MKTSRSQNVRIIRHLAIMLSILVAIGVLLLVAVLIYIQILLRDLRSTDSTKVVHASWKLSYIQEDKATPQFIKNLEHPSWKVRQASAMVLSKLREKQAVPSLIKRLTDEDHRVRLSTLAALREITNHDLGYNPKQTKDLEKCAEMAKKWQEWWQAQSPGE